MTIINPATQELIQEIAEDTKEIIAGKYKKLKEGQPAWAAKTVQERIDIIQHFYDLLEEEKTELAKTLTAEMGKPLQQSYNEINGARSRIKYFIDNAAKYLAEEWVVREGGTKEKIVYEPLGVISNISAWNYPYLVGTNVFIAALIGGNAVLYKPSEYTLLTGLHMQRLFHKAGVPENVFILAAGGAAVGEAIVELPLNGYFFTGSYHTGKYIAEKTAHKLVPVQLELGGKDPLYIADDVEDVKAVAASTADGAFYNNGQSCCSVERIYVHEKIYDEYVAAFLQEVKSWKTGLPTEEGVYIGPLTRPAQIKVLEHQVKDAVDKGAILLSGGKKIQGAGNYFEPTVLTNVNNQMALMRDESFGPVIGIMKVRNDEEAVQLMQDTDYGLTAGVYSKNFDRAENIMRQMNTGTVYWNCCDRVSATLPWSGRKNSGLGSTLSHQGIYAFVQPKAYHIRG
ncbi:MAG TPA: aldehyde dehydrogenase family protein [Chitinophagaceae bacterium]|nr:aldehyde dehydrogenase family protein [Chitinophagaceae bacterium]